MFKKFLNGILVFFSFILIFLFFSCASNISDGKLISTRTEFSDRLVKSLYEIEGEWKTDSGIRIKYPFSFNEIEYVLVEEPESDVTDDLRSFFLNNNSDNADFIFQKIWESRFSMYSDFPKIRNDGVQFGLKFSKNRSDGKNSISIAKTYLIPEYIAKKNLECFAFHIEEKYTIIANPVTKIEDSTVEEKIIFLNLTDKFNSFSKEFYDLKPNPERVGLVLSGGGGKGAYEIGVWKALDEFGFSKKITEISGTSVGGLNAALFSCVPFSVADDLWRNIVPTELKSDEKLISQKGLERVIDSIDLKSISLNIFPKVFVTAIRNKNRVLKFFTSDVGSYAQRFCLNEEKDVSELKKKLLATSAFPLVMNPVKLKDGCVYSDGGQEFLGGDNTPVEPILQDSDSVEKLIIVYLSSNLKSKERRTGGSIPVLEVIPTKDLGNFLSGTANFDSQKISDLIDLGYEDTVRIFSQRGYHPIPSFWFE